MLESTGGRGDDAIELLIAARNEPALKDSACSGDDGAAEGASTTAHADTSGKSSPQGSGKSSPQGSGGSEGGNSDGKGLGLSNGNGSKSETSSPAPTATKAAKKVARASECPCGSGLKYKKCCRKKDAAIARGQNAAPEPKKSTAPADDSSLANDLGFLVIRFDGMGLLDGPGLLVVAVGGEVF